MACVRVARELDLTGIVAQLARTLDKRLAAWKAELTSLQTDVRRGRVVVARARVS